MCRRQTGPERDHGITIVLHIAEVKGLKPLGGVPPSQIIAEVRWRVECGMVKAKPTRRRSRPAARAGAAVCGSAPG